MQYTLTIFYPQWTLGRRAYYGMTLAQAVRSARIAAIMGHDFDIKEEW